MHTQYFIVFWRWKY